MQQMIWLSIGSSRKETSWKNVQMEWPELVKRMSTTVVTPETLKEYLGFAKPLQDERKDVGGYVGGTIAGGRRKKAAVTSRSLITLDVDFGTMDFWEDFIQFYPNAAFIYGTHKHSEKAPRFRLVMPLSREVKPDEYQAISRHLAGNLDIEVFDPTTFQAERLMYWPSTPRDQVYYCREQKGQFLDADHVLSLYADWRDQSQWPVSVKVEQLVQGDIAKQGNPLEKPGMIGVFCRTYGISDVIDKYLPEVYGMFGDDGDRYSFLGGSTAGGLVVYDDLFAYSHHATDPASGKCCNAWDLVRLHKYSQLDLDVKDRTNIGKLPSQSAMLDLVNQDKTVMGLMGAEKLHAAREMFEDAGEDMSGHSSGSGLQPITPDVEDLGWIAELEADKKGQYLTTYKNISLILDNDPYIKGRIRYNLMNNRMEVVRSMPWDEKGQEYPRFWEDDDWSQLRKLLGMAPYELLRSPKLEDCMAGVRRSNSYHPVREYLNGLQWDGQRRLDELVIDFLGAEDTEYTRTVTRKTFVAAVARVMQPGIKFEHLLILVGTERIGKSTLYARMGGQWFTDSFNFTMLAHGNKAYEQIRGRWIIEVPEMAGLKKAEVEHAKSFISSQQDNYRPAYGKEMAEQKRQSILVGTSNKRDFLKKFGGGNRRFWPVDCHVNKPEWSIFKGLTPAVVDLVWAEALEYFRRGETLYLSPELEDIALSVRRGYEEKDDMTGIIQNFLDTKLPGSWADKSLAERVSYFHYKDDFSEVGITSRDKVCGPEIWCECLKKNKGDMTTVNTKFIHDIMSEMPGWERSKWKIRFKEYGFLTGYVRIGSEVAAIATENE